MPAEEDRISNLPDLLIDSILERLPIEDAVRTSILSKQWRYKWTTICALVFDKQFSVRFAMNGAFGRNGFVRVVNHVLFLHNGPILKFVLHIPDMLLDSFQEVDQWILMLSRNGVRELILTNSDLHRYKLPSYLYSCLELRRLELENCTMKPPCEFQGFPNLEYLYLRLVNFESNLGGSVINLPQLKGLDMIKCSNAYNFNIKAARLKGLVVVGSPDAPLLRLLNSECLVAFVIHSPKPTQGSAAAAQVDRMIWPRMLNNLPNMVYFGTNGHFLKLYIAENIRMWLPHTVNSLMGLDLVNVKFGDPGQFEAVLCMLRNSPNLEKLTVRNDQMGLGDVEFDVEATSYYLMDQPLKQLQTVIITSVEGSHVELLFIKLLLKHCPDLKSMIIRLGTTVDDYRRLEFAKDVMRSTRASMTAQVLIPYM